MENNDFYVLWEKDLLCCQAVYLVNRSPVGNVQERV